MRYRGMPDESPPEDPGKERLLPDEAKSMGSGNLDELRHWVDTYRELYDFKEHLLVEIADQKQRVSVQGRVELDNDRKLVESERDRIGRRLTYWEQQLENRGRS